MENIDEKITCLVQLRLSKWQLVWVRHHDIRMIEQVDFPEVMRASLAGQNVTAVKQELEKRVSMKNAEIKYTVAEIAELDKEIAEAQQTKEDGEEPAA